LGDASELQERYFKWFTRAAGYAGGSSFQLFVSNIKADAVAKLSDADKTRLQPILDAKPETDVPVFTASPRSFVKEWTMDELVPLLETGLTKRDFDRGRQMFGAATCFACHRFDNQGGSVGPDLTILSGRFSRRDVLESVMEPSKQISDQYGSVRVLTTDGKVVVGRIINLAGDSFQVQTDMMKPGALTGVDRKLIEEMVESKVSMMPKGLLNSLQQDEILDLMAYLLSRGDRGHAMFKR
jgi:putative heme-binding domain-containing protein